MSFDTFPDAEAIAVAVLLEADVCDGRVYAGLPADLELAACSVTRVGGLPAERHHLDVASVQVSVWAEDKAAARDAAAAARVALHEAEGTTVTYDEDSGFITAVEDYLGLSYAPDPDADNRHRYIFGVNLTLHT